MGYYRGKRRSRSGSRLKKGDYCVAFDGPEKCVVKLIEVAPGYQGSWHVEDIETNERWERAVPESELGEVLTEMEVIAIMRDLE